MPFQQLRLQTCCSVLLDMHAFACTEARCLSENDVHACAPNLRLGGWLAPIDPFAGAWRPAGWVWVSGCVCLRSTATGRIGGAPNGRSTQWRRRRRPAHACGCAEDAWTARRTYVMRKIDRDGCMSLAGRP